MSSINAVNDPNPTPNLPQFQVADVTDSLIQQINPANPRDKLIFDSLVRHLHGFIAETNITTKEWETAIRFLTRVGQNSTPIRQEFILLSDVLGVSSLVDALNNPTVGTCTESSVLGPFYHDAPPEIRVGESIASEGKGDYLLVEGRVLSPDGQPIPGAVIDTWEADDHGRYDVQNSDPTIVDCRARLYSGQDGKYVFRAIVPASYGVPSDGPVGDLLLHLGKHTMRAAHIHFVIEAPGFRKLTTALYFEGDPYLESDSVFGVKKSLIVKLKNVTDEHEARSRGFTVGDEFKLLEFDFVLSPE